MLNMLMELPYFLAHIKLLINQYLMYLHTHNVYFCSFFRNLKSHNTQNAIDCSLYQGDTLLENFRKLTSFPAFEVILKTDTETTHNDKLRMTS